MAATTTSKHTVFQTIAEHPNYYWPYYRLPETEDTATDLDALEHEVHRLASAWFKQEAHDDVEAFICWCPLSHLDFSPYDAHPAWHAQSKPVVPTVRALMLIDLHGWEHETAFVRYLADHPDLVTSLGFEKRPDQATLWRARHERFSAELLDAISERGHDYLVPKRKQTSEKAVARRMEQHDVETAVNERGLHLRNNEWHETNLLYLPKSNFTGEIEERQDSRVIDIN